MASLFVPLSNILRALLTFCSSQTLPGWFGRKVPCDVLGRVLGSYYLDGFLQHFANMVPWILGISI